MKPTPDTAAPLNHEYIHGICKECGAIEGKNPCTDTPAPGETYLKITGQDIWAMLSASFETPKLVKQWEEQELRRWLENNYRNLPINIIRMVKSEVRKNDNERKTDTRTV